MNEEQPNVKEFKGKPDVFVVDEGKGVIGVTTSEHMKVEHIPLEEYLKQIIEESRKYGDSIIHKYDYPDGEWFPCGTANLVLRWNQHREMIDLFRKTSAEGRKGRNDFWTGWFGRLMKTSSQGMVVDSPDVEYTSNEIPGRSLQVHTREANI